MVLQVLGSFIKLVATILDRSAVDNGETTEGLNQQSGMLWQDESVSSAWVDDSEDSAGLKTN